MRLFVGTNAAVGGTLNDNRDKERKGKMGKLNVAAVNLADEAHELSKFVVHETPLSFGLELTA